VKTHRIVLHPGDRLDVQLSERLVNGYEDGVGSIDVCWQDRDAPVGEVATQGRELQLRWSAERGRVGPVVFSNR
jgi:hypothetical protein